MHTEIKTAVESFVKQVQAMINAQYAREYERITPPTMTVEYGKRYAKVIRNETFGSGRSVYCFIDADGSILKSASWKAPAKGVRGSVLADNPLTAVTAYGAVSWA
jgi:hypothetical protein